MTSDYVFTAASTAAELNKVLKEARSERVLAKAATQVSLSVLANVSTQYLVQSIYASLAMNGVRPDIYEAPFDQWELELNNPDSETNRRKADYLLLILSSVRLLLDPAVRNPARFAASLRDLLANYKARGAGQSEVVVVLPERLREGFDQTSWFARSVDDLKQELRRELHGVAHLIDVDPLIAEFGFERWHPSKFLATAKLCCHPNCFPLYGNYVALFIQSLIARPVKLIVTDLDNTLWHGTVGDLGWDGVGLDKDSTGYPHLMLQHYLRSLKESGTLLAICSKNDLADARAVFENRREMVLGWDDFSAHEINWEPKSVNIRRVLDRLALTTSGVVFLDDSPFEREQVKSDLPDIFVPTLPATADLWTDYLSRSGRLTVAAVRDHDVERSRRYELERRRNEDAAAHVDYSSFLRQLNLEVTPAPVSSANFDRVFELIHKTNQFNLTTRRLGRGELAAWAARGDGFCYCYSLKDKYSDYGIISVFMAEKRAGGWHIDSWLMSCRAIGRGVEEAVFRHFVSTAARDGETISAAYIPTEKNRLVEPLLARMGFVHDPDGGASRFVVGRDSSPQAEYIVVSTGNVVGRQA